ncbi:MAG: hypothetical protein LBE84_12230 [Planctomycetota bacterium]|nr:hypothetical protein [Planctomycetota bacterium]
MRKFIVVAALTLTPLAIWIAGCRDRGQQARFPKGPEVKRLAMSSGRRDSGAPEIPAAIDPDIMNTPDQPTFARIQAVMDREAQLSSRHSAPGLFVIPRQDYTNLAAVPDAATDRREFHSIPMTPDRDRMFNRGYVPADVSAMAPPGFMAGPGLPPTTAHDFVPPEMDLPLSDIPGVFMGNDPPSPEFQPLSLMPALPGGDWLEMSIPGIPEMTDIRFAAAEAADVWHKNFPLDSFLPTPAMIIDKPPDADDVRLALAPLPELPVGSVLAAGFVGTSEAGGNKKSGYRFASHERNSLQPAAASPRQKGMKTPRTNRRDDSRYLMDIWGKYPVVRKTSAPAVSLSDFQLDEPMAIVPPGELEANAQTQIGDGKEDLDLAREFPSVIELLKTLESEEQSGGGGAKPVQPVEMATGDFGNGTVRKQDDAGTGGTARKVTLLPSRNLVGRKSFSDKMLHQIDSQVEAPPVVF